jgi:hypothetical protein
MTVSGPPQFPWVGKDPRGRTVILTQKAWDHSAPHFSQFSNPVLNLPPDPFGSVTRTLEKPDTIFDNPPSRGAPRRVGRERYYRLDGRCDPPHVVVVVKILLRDEVIEGYSAKAGDRVVKTLFVEDAEPNWTSLWVKP